jgi:hypothetical protein
VSRWAKLGAFLLLTLPAGLLRAQPDEPQQRLPIRQFGGINTKFNPLALENGQTPDSQNVVTDLGQGIEGRQGFVSFSTDAAKGMWTFSLSNGTKYFIRQSTTTGTLAASTGNGTFNVLIGTAPSNVVVSAAQLGDKWFYADQTNGLKYWNGTAVTVVGSTLTFNQIVAHKGRIWGSGIASAARTIYGSRFNDGTYWTLQTSPADTDPVQIVVGGGRDEIITALYASFQDKLMWFTSRSFGAIYGTDRSDFLLRTFSQDIGTAYPESIQDCDGFLRFLGPRRTIWEFDGVKFVKISEVIDSVLQNIVQGDANGRTYTWTDKTDFDLGTNRQTSNAITQGSVVLSTWTDTDTSGSDFGAGTLTNVTTQTLAGVLYLSTNNVNVANNSFESGSGTDADNWTEVTANDVRSAALSIICNGTPGTVSPQSGSWMMRMNRAVPEDLVIKIYDAGGTLISSINKGAVGDASADCSWRQITQSLSDYTGRNIKVGITSSGNASEIKTDTFFCSGNTFTFYLNSAVQFGGSLQPYKFIDLVEGGRSTIYSGSFTSRTFDTAFSKSYYAGSHNESAFGHTITLQTQVSSDGSSWDTAETWSGAAPTTGTKRYIRYLVSVSTTSSATNLPFVSDVTFSAIAGTGTWVSDSVALGNITAFNRFLASEVTDGGAIGYTVYSDTDATKTITNGVPVATSFTSSQVVTSNSLISLSPSAYAFVMTSFTVTAADQNPTVNDVSIQWDQGSTLKVASAYPNQRYWLAVAQGSATNNRVLVFDRNREWQIYNGINADAMHIYTANVFFANTNGIYQGETSNSDNGSSIASYFVTKTYNPSNSLGVGSYFDDIYVNSERSDATLATTYRVDEVATDYSLASVTLSDSNNGLFGIKLPFPFSSLQQGRYLRLKLSVSGTSAWRINGVDLTYVPDVEEQ